MSSCSCPCKNSQRGEFLLSSHSINHVLSLPLIFSVTRLHKGFLNGSDGKESSCNVGDPRFEPWIRNIPWRRKWQPTLVFLPRKSHGQRSLVGYSLCVHKRVGHSWVIKQQSLHKHSWLSFSWFQRLSHLASSSEPWAQMRSQGKPAKGLQQQSWVWSEGPHGYCLHCVQHADLP